MKRHILTGLILILILTGCSSDRESETADFLIMSKTATEPALMMEAEGQPVTGNSAPGETGTQEPAANRRKRIYNGNAEIVVDKPDEIRTKLEKTAIESGGYVESSYSGFVALRIPSERFREIFDTILTMGRVRSQEIRTWDVTDQFADTAQRLATAEKTRERLYDLLKKTTDPKERARILKEIGRLSEEIEAVKQQLVLMESRIAYSRITVGIIPRLEDGAVSAEIPFPWISSLSPLSPVSNTLKARLTLNPGETFAVFSKEDIFLAEDAEGATISLSTVENSPLGDSRFWQKALLFHLSTYYETAEPLTIQLGNSEFKGARFTSKDAAPFLYVAAVLDDGKNLHVLEIFSPRSDRDMTPLFTALKGGEIK